MNTLTRLHRPTALLLLRLVMVTPAFPAIVRLAPMVHDGTGASSPKNQAAERPSAPDAS